MTSDKPKVIAIVGPTASGKSSLGIRLAKKFNGEIISADSRQVYRGMDIGTGKVTKKEMVGVAHHLLSVANPKTQFSVAKYKKLAEKAVKQIIIRKKIPIIVGGTGFYLDALIKPNLVPNVPPNSSLRKKLQNKNAEQLAGILKKLDKKTWDRIDRQNPRRLLRAIEIAKALGKVPTNSAKTRDDWKILVIGLSPDKEALKKKIASRLKERLRQGMISEVSKLKKAGLSWKKLDDFGLEYRHIARYLQGKIAKDEMIKNLQSDIEHYAKRQMTWFKRDKQTRWIKSTTEATKIAKKFLES